MLDIFFKQNSTIGSDEESFIENVGDHQFPLHFKLKEIFDLLPNSDTVHWVSKGQWSAIDLLIKALSYTGPAEVWLSSYAMSERPAKVLADFVVSKTITDLYCLVDSRIDVRSATALTLVQNCAKACKLLDTHAKATVIHNETHCITIVGSANYTSNRRYEAGIISRLPAIKDFHLSWMKYAFEYGND